MKNGVKTWADRIFDPFNIQFYFIVCTFFVEIPLLMGYMGWWKVIGLVWAALTILYDLCTRRRCLESRGALLAFCLLAAYALTTLLVKFRYPAGYHETYLDLFCSVIALLILYPPFEKERMGRLRLLDRTMILLITLASAVGIGMFLLHVGGYFYSPINEYDYPVGFVSARLTGIYRNAIYPTPLIGVGAALIEWVQSKKLWGRLLLALSLLINCWHILLSNSRGPLIALAAMGGFFALFLIRRRLAGIVPWKAWGAGACAALVLAGALLGLAGPARRACGALPVALRKLVAVSSPFPSMPTQGKPFQLPTEPAEIREDEMEREIPENYGTLTGRPAIWRQGWQFFLKEPVFGYGPYALKDEVRISATGTERLSHFHNILIQSLVSLGTVGTLFFLALLGAALFPLCVALFRRREDPGYPVLVGISALLFSLLLINMADVTLFFLSKNSEFVFWTYLGFALPLAGAKPLGMDRPLQRLSRRLPRWGD